MRGQEDAFLSLLDGHLVRARHWTRLLDHDVEAIRSQGLRSLDIGLIHERLDQAHQRGLLTDAEHATLRSEHVLAGDGERYGRRADQVCLKLSAEAAPHDLPSVWRFLTFWGGEAIHWRHYDGEPSLVQKLRSLGRPALVTAALDFSTPDQHRVHRSLVHAFVGKALGHAPANADIFYQRPVPAEHIESVVFPGNQAYDRLPGLPAA
ncbi:hypothetical protein AB0D66_26955 [Streptomyces sp. NPDC048270]|uniref:hypothetical protein n=1 Tax=Streptomyces sp. NPDC048270 TaxID=3154615 RepID=UPI0033E26F09